MGPGIADDEDLDLGAALALQEHAFAFGLYALGDHRDRMIDEAARWRWRPPQLATWENTIVGGRKPKAAP